MFGYATDETEECMPMTVVLAHKLNEKIADLRRSGDFWWARPDSKTQVWRHSTLILGLSLLQVLTLGYSRIYIGSRGLRTAKGAHYRRLTPTQRKDHPGWTKGRNKNESD